MKTKLLQHCCIWFSYARGDTLQRCTADLRILFGHETLTERSIRGWWRAFKSGARHKDNISDHVKTGRPRTARTDANATLVLNLILEDRHLTIEQIHHETQLSTGSIHKILHKDLGLSRIAAKFVPKILSEEQKTRCLAISQQWLEDIEQDDTVLDRIITGDKSWVWCYDPETKQQSSQWLRKGIDQCPKKCLRGKSRKKVLLTVFFDSSGIVHKEYATSTVTTETYIETLMNLRNSIRLNRPQLWTHHNWILLDDNASAHTSYDTMEFHHQVLTNRGPHPPYSPDLAPCDFFLFPRMKARMHGINYETIDRLKQAVQDSLDKFTQEDFKQCFANLQHRWECCVEADGSYFEGDKH